jgi:hypothetical protein
MTTQFATWVAIGGKRQACDEQLQRLEGIDARVLTVRRRRPRLVGWNGTGQDSLILGHDSQAGRRKLVVAAVGGPKV